MGYFVDETSRANEEFDSGGTAIEGNDASGGYDLLSILMHELGHALDLSHDASDAPFMSGFLDPSQRLGLFAAANDDAAPAGSDEVTYYDPRVDAMVTQDEMMLLDAVADIEPETTPQPTPVKGNGKGRVKWAAQ